MPSPSYKVQYKNSKGEMVDIPLIAEAEPYTNNTPVPTTIGGISKGTIFNNKKISDVLDMLLYPYVAHSITATAMPNGRIIEIGDYVELTSVTVNITLGSSPISHIEVYSNIGGLLGSVGGVTIGAGNTEIPTQRRISSNETISVKVYDKKGTVKSANAAVFTFVSPYYYGVIESSDPINSSTISSLTKDLKTKGTKSYTYNMSKQRAVIAYPSSYGQIKKILDINSFDVTDTFDREVITINDVEYYVYVLSTPATSAMTYAFSY